MSMVVKKHYPVDNLPVELREGLPDRRFVEVVIKLEPDERIGKKLRSFVGLGCNVHGDEHQVLEHLRSQQDDD